MLALVTQRSRSAVVGVGALLRVIAALGYVASEQAGFGRFC